MPVDVLKPSALHLSSLQKLPSQSQMISQGQRLQENKKLKEKEKLATLSLWHQHIGHIGERALRALLKETGVNHLIGALKDNFKLCELCL